MTKLKDIINHFRLENGFSCYIRNVDVFQNFVTMALTINVGSLCEDEGHRGIAHLLEHLLMSFYTLNLYGNTKYKAHAYTDFREMVFFIKGPVDGGNITTFIEIMSGIANGTFLKREFFQRIKEDVLKEIHEEEKMITLPRVLLEKSDYERFYAIGHLVDVVNMNYDEVFSFFNTFFSPDKMSLAIVGNITEGIVRESVIDSFKDMKKKSTFMRNVTLSIPDYKEKEINISRLVNNEVIIVIKKEKCKSDNNLRNQIIDSIAIDVIINFLNSQIVEYTEKAIEEYEKKIFDSRFIFYILRVQVGGENISSSKLLKRIKRCMNSIHTLNEFGSINIQKKITELKKYILEGNIESNYTIHQMLLECMEAAKLDKDINSCQVQTTLYMEYLKELQIEEVYNHIISIMSADKMYLTNK